MRPTDNIKNEIKNMKFKASEELKQKMLADVLNAQNTKQHSTQTPQSVWRIIMKSNFTKLATAAIVAVAILVGINRFGGSIDVTSVALADVKKAVNQMPLLHTVLQYEIDGEERYTERWHCFESRITLSKYSLNGKCYKISSMNYDTMENIVYDPDSDEVKILWRVDIDPKSPSSTPWSIIGEYIDNYILWGADISNEKGSYNGNDVDTYYFSIACDFRGDREKAEFVVNRSSHLPILYKSEKWDSNGQLKSARVKNFDFPEDGPKNIYDLGVSKTTTVVRDSESKERLDRKMELLEEKAVYDEQFKEIYHLEEGEVLRYMPPPLPESRLKMDEISNTIRILNREGSLLMPPLSPREKDQMIERHYSVYRWDGTIASKDEAIIRDGVTLKTVLDRMIHLSRFQYDNIPKKLADISIPGDWIIRNDTPKEQLLKAFEEILQGFTDDPIRFEKRQVECDVIAVRGKYRFKPLTDTYDDRWIHVYSDTLDPDSGGGGGTSSLDSFLTQRLAETQLKQQVVNLTESSGDIRIKYGCHMSAYLGKIEPGAERDAKLDLLLENLSRQTSLVFTKERRKIDVWYIAEGN